MVAAEKHPGPELLSDYALGRLVNGEFDAVSDHIDQCGDCQETLSHLQLPDDTLVRGLAGEPPHEPFASEPEFAAALSAMLRGDVAGSGRSAATQDLRGGETIALSEMPLEALRDYELLGPLGQGGMGMVYRARHTRLDRLVAVKVLPAERMRQPAAIARFHREMKAVGNLDHPHIVRAYDAGEVDGKHFLAMELIDGVDLGTLAEREGPLRIADACELVRQAAVGLDCAHRNGLVHRDVKPSNLMLDRGGVVKVLDLGLARLLGEAASDGDRAKPQAADAGQTAGEAGARFPAIGADITGTDQAMGTPDYMAPEQCLDSRAVDGRSDVYSLGATLYRLLAGVAPYSGAKYDTLAKKIAGLTKDPVPPIVEHRGDLPAGLVSLLNRLLAKEPNGRPASPGDVAAGLAPFCRGHRVLELASGVEAKTHAKGPPRRWLLLAAALGAAIVAAGIVLLRISTRDGELIVEVDAAARDTVSVEVRKGEEVRIVGSDAKHPDADWAIELNEGTWNVKLKGDGDRFKLDRETVEITRGGQQLVKVTRRPMAEAPLPSPSPSVAAPRAEAAPKRPAPRIGVWRLSLPAGFVRGATLSASTDGQFHLQTGGVLSGEYRWDGQRLTVSAPEDTRFRGLAWAWANEDEKELVLVAEPNSHPSGQSYLGARLAYQGGDSPPVVTSPSVVRRFFVKDDVPLERVGVMRDGDAWRFTATETRTFKLFEIANPDVADCILKYQAVIKTKDIASQAYLELVCRMPGQDEAVSRGYHNAATGTTDWAAHETPFLLPAGGRPELVRLNLVIEGGGTAWLRDVELLASPLPEGAAGGTSR